MAFQITCQKCGAVQDCDDSMKDKQITCTNCNAIANPAALDSSSATMQTIAPPPEENRLKFKKKKAPGAPVYDPAMFPRPTKPKVSALAVTLIVFGVLSALAFLFNLIFVMNNWGGISALFVSSQTAGAAVQTATLAFLLLMNALITLIGAVAMFLAAAAVWNLQKTNHTAATAAVIAEEALFLAKENADGL